MPRKSPASRTHIRRIGLLGLLLTTLLAPAGIVVGTVTAAALIGGAFHLSRAEPETVVTPPHPVSGKTGNLQHLDIERDGKTVALVIAEGPPEQGSGADSFDPANPLFAGLAGNGPTQPGTPGGMPSGRSPGNSMPAGGFGPDSGSPAYPPSLGGPPGGGAPTGKGDTDETSNEADGPEKPNETPILPPPPVKPQPNPDNQPPEKGSGLPPDTLPGPNTLPGLPTPPPTGDLPGLQPPPGMQLPTQSNAVPEPSMLGLMLLGVAALAWSGRRRPDSLSPA